MGITELADLVRRGLDADQETAELATAGPWLYHDTHLNQGGHTATVMTDREDMNQTELVAWLPSWSHEPWDETRNVWRTAMHVARFDPARVLRDVAARRQLLDQALAWQHHEADDPWYSCPASAHHATAVGAAGLCDCGRDERVHAVLQLLAQPYRETDHG